MSVIVPPHAGPLAEGQTISSPVTPLYFSFFNTAMAFA